MMTKEQKEKYPNAVTLNVHWKHPRDDYHYFDALEYDADQNFLRITDPRGCKKLIPLLTIRWIQIDPYSGPLP